ncbi:hypothetical protein HNS03_16010 [Amorphus sp. 3PC139-8]
MRPIAWAVMPIRAGPKSKPAYPAAVTAAMAMLSGITVCRPARLHLGGQQHPYPARAHEASNAKDSVKTGHERFGCGPFHLDRMDVHCDVAVEQIGPLLELSQEKRFPLFRPGVQSLFRPHVPALRAKGTSLETVRRTPKRLRSASLSCSDGGKTLSDRLSWHLFAVSGAETFAFMSP